MGIEYPEFEDLIGLQEDNSTSDRTRATGLPLDRKLLYESF